MVATGATWNNTLRVNVWSATGNGSPQSITAKLFGCAGCTSQTTFGPTGTGSWYGTATFTKGGLTAGSVVSLDLSSGQVDELVGVGAGIWS